MFKLKLSIWHKPTSTHNRGLYLGIAFDYKSFAAMEQAVRAGCYGPASKTQFYSEYVDPVSGVTSGPLFEKKKGRLVAVLPFEVANNWLEIAKESAILDREINKRFARRFVATKWELLPFNFVNPFLAK